MNEVREDRVEEVRNRNGFLVNSPISGTVQFEDEFSTSTLICNFSKLNQFAPALRVFTQMLSRGFLPGNRVLPSVIKACSGLLALKLGQQVHSLVFVCGFAFDSFIQSSLMHMYLKCNRLRDAHDVFRRIQQRDVVVWSALIAGYSRQGSVTRVKELCHEMRETGIIPNLVLWNGMVNGFNRSGFHSEAVVMFQKMHSEGLSLDGYSISSVLPALGDLQDYQLGIQVHNYAIKQGLHCDNCVASALIDMYGKCNRSAEMSRVFGDGDCVDVGARNALVTGLSRNGFVDDALEAFKWFKDQRMELNIVSWTAMISSCSQNGKDIEALELFREMQAEGVVPNSVTIPCLLPACGNIVALMHGKAAHCFSIRREFSNDVYVGTAIVDMYAKCGKIQMSKHYFDKMPGRNLASWNAIMRGYAMHGNAVETIDVFKSMQKAGMKPDSISFTCILSACSQRGLTKEGWYYFDSMQPEHGIEPRLEHYACMVTLLGRAGKLEEAFSMIKNMPLEADACVWGALLSSCRVYRNIDLGEAAATKLFELEPKNPGNYILLSNIYASNGLWAEVDRIRDAMKGVGLRKNPGCSWIEVKNKVHMLLAGDKSHPQMNRIIEKLQELSKEMRKSGYLPSTDFVLQDVEEQDKEEILCGHSEKLAVVFGLLNTRPGSSLRVIKNLRICGDCHAVIKFISSFESREISVRDTNRFHHFKDGVCSCEDYW